jgi:hypothetical protein
MGSFDLSDLSETNSIGATVKHKARERQYSSEESKVLQEFSLSFSVSTPLKRKTLNEELALQQLYATNRS